MHQPAFECAVAQHRVAALLSEQRDRIFWLHAVLDQRERGNESGSIQSGLAMYERRPHACAFIYVARQKEQQFFIRNFAAIQHMGVRHDLMLVEHVGLRWI